MSQAFQAEPVAVIAAGALFPGSLDRPGYWASLCRGDDCIGPVPEGRWKKADHFDANPSAPDMVYAHRGGFLEQIPFTPAEFGISPTSLQATDSSQLLSLWVTRRLFLEAGLAWNDAVPGRKFDRSRVSVILGVTGAQQLMLPLGARLDRKRWHQAMIDAGVEETLANKAVEGILDLYPPWLENSFPGLLGNVVAGRIAHRFDLGGSNCVVDAACASSLGALHLGVLELQAGRSDLVVGGGVDTFNDPFMYACFSKTPALSAQGNSRPFDKNADGTILGEGVGLVLLKRLSDARRDHDRVLGVIRSVGASSDGLGSAVHAPKREGQVSCLKRAYEIAGVDPRSISLVEAHGTGTKVGDATELAGLVEVFQDGKGGGPWCALGSVKSQIGHTKAAAGAAGLIKALLALHYQVIPPTIKVSEPQGALRDPDCPFYLADRPRPWLAALDGSPRRAGISAFGFGGSNYHAVLEEAPPAGEAAVAWDPDVWMAAISAPDDAGLHHRLAELASRLKERPSSLMDHEWAQMVARESRSHFKTSDSVRMVLVGNLRTGAGLQPANLVASAQGGGKGPGIYRGHGPVRGKFAILFPGQGSQEPDMLLRLAVRFPEVREILGLAEMHFAKRFPGIPGLCQTVYPIRKFEAKEETLWRDRIRDTRYAQMALAALSLGAYKVLDRFGVRPDFLAGHSLGEWTALAAAGRLTPEAMVELVGLRASLMSQSKGNGAMLAVLASEEKTRSILDTIRCPLSLANRNSANQVVFAGPREMVDRAHALLAQQSVRSIILDVADAFHTSVMSHAVAPLQAALAPVPFAKGGAVIANVTARPYPEDAASARALLAGQLAQPVQWAQTVEYLAAQGVDTILECGPGRKLCGLAQATLGSSAIGLALDPSPGLDLIPLAQILAQLAVLGHPVDLAAWDQGEWENRVPTRSSFTVGIDGALRKNAGSKKDKTDKELPAKTKSAEPQTLALPVPGPSSVAPIAVPDPKAARETAVPLRSASNPSLPRKDEPPVSSMDPQPNPAPPSPTHQGVSLVSSSHPVLAFGRESLAALQSLQEQTARLHRQFLEGQELAQKTLQSLIEQQTRYLTGSLNGHVATPAPVIASAPIPAPVAPVTYPVAHQAKPAPVAPAAAALPVAPIAPPLKVAPPAAPTPFEVPLLKVPEPVWQPAPVAPAVPAPKSVARSAANEGVLALLTRIVSEKTGYPIDSLEADMALDTDLGIDSIKRVEILSAVQEALPGAPQIGAEHMGTLRTLRQLADYLAGGSKAPMVAPVAAVAAVVEAPVPARNGSATLKPKSDASGSALAVLTAIISEKTGYPKESLEPDMALDTDLGIDSIKRVEILSAVQEALPGAPPVGAEHMGTLRTLRQLADHLSGGPPAFFPERSPREPAANRPQAPGVTFPVASEPSNLARWALVARELPQDPPKSWVGPGTRIAIVADDPQTGRLLLESLRHKGCRADLSLLGDRPQIPERLEMLLLAVGFGALAPLAEHRALAWVQAALPFLSESVGRGAAQVCLIAREPENGSAHLPGRAQLVQSGLSGLIKTVRWEAPGVATQVIRVAGPVEKAVADAIGRPGFEETMFEGDQPRALSLLETTPLEAGASPIEPGDLVLVTGGARGVTAVCSRELALRTGCRLVLLGRTPLPGAEPQWLAGISSEAEIRKAIGAHTAEKLAPRQIMERASALLAAREVRENLRSLEAAGIQAHYVPLDVQDAHAAQSTITDLTSRYGPVKGILHGAGVLADSRLAEKTTAQMDRVIGTKVDGLLNLLSPIDLSSLKFLLLFGSSTGRFGRLGQADYAVANESLAALARWFARNLPGCRTRIVDWGPWDGGMVNAGLKVIFAAEGVGLIPLVEGARFLVREIFAPSAPALAEVVALAQSSRLPEAPATPAPVAAVLAAEPTEKAETPQGPEWAFDRLIDRGSHPILDDHVLDGRPVVPLALLSEWLGQASCHLNPGYQVVGFEELRVLHGVRLDQGHPVQISAHAGRFIGTEDSPKVAVEIRGPRGTQKSAPLVRGQMMLAPMGSYPALPPYSPYAFPARKFPFEKSDWYGKLLFHGPSWHGIEEIEGFEPLEGSHPGIVCRLRTAPPPAAWLTQPHRSRWILDPLAIDCAFQMMILFSQAQLGAPCLPALVRAYRQFRVFPAEGCRAVLRIERCLQGLVRGDIDFLTHQGLLIGRMEGVEAISDPALSHAFQRNQVAAS